MARTFPDIRKLKAWPLLERAGFVAESFRDDQNRVNCIGAVYPSPWVGIYRNEEGPALAPWVVSVPGAEEFRVCSGRELPDLVKTLAPWVFKKVPAVVVIDGGDITETLTVGIDRIEVKRWLDGKIELHIYPD